MKLKDKTGPQQRQEGKENITVVEYSNKYVAPEPCIKKNGPNGKMGVNNLYF